MTEEQDKVPVGSWRWVRRHVSSEAGDRTMVTTYCRMTVTRPGVEEVTGLFIDLQPHRGLRTADWRDPRLITSQPVADFADYQPEGADDPVHRAATEAQDQGHWAPIEMPQLRRPDRSDPDGFAREVAAAYWAAVQAGRPPGVTIADAARVPVTTVHGWIREARRRGALPPARQGRAG